MQSRVSEPSYLETLWRSSTWENWREILKSQTEIEEERRKGHKRHEAFLWHLSHSGSALLWVEKVPDGGKETTEEGRREVKQLMSDWNILPWPSLFDWSFVLFPLALVCRSWFASSHVSCTSQKHLPAGVVPRSNQSLSSRSSPSQPWTSLQQEHLQLTGSCLQNGDSPGSSVAVSLWHMAGLLQVSLSVLLPQKNLKFLPDEFHRLRSSRRCSSEVG